MYGDKETTNIEINIVSNYQYVQTQRKFLFEG